MNGGKQMSASDKIAMASLALSGISVVVTAIFSYLVWIVSKQNKDAAVLTSEIARSTFEQQRITEENIRFQMKNSMFEKMMNIRNCVILQATSDIDINFLKKQKREHGLTEYELSKYFSDKQIRAIFSFWSNFTVYLNKHFLDSNGVFRDLNQSEVEGIKETSAKLREYLDKLIEDFYNE